MGAHPEIGLISMRKRVRPIGGNISITSNVGGETSIEVYVPSSRSIGRFGPYVCNVRNSVDNIETVDHCRCIKRRRLKVISQTGIGERWWRVR